MKYLLLGLISPLLFLSLTGCVTHQPRSIYIYTVKKYCPQGYILMTDNTCKRSSDLNKPFYSVSGTVTLPYIVKTPRKAIRKPKKQIKKDRVIECKQVMRDMNKCMGESVY